MRGRNQPKVFDAPRLLAFRVQVAELERTEQLVKATGKTEADLLREALSQFLDQHIEKPLRA